MSSTRKAKDDSVFHQNRYASSPEFERGLLANLTAKRCSAIDAAADRELIWFVQYQSHQPGGIAGLAKELIAKFPHRLGTPAMVAAGKTGGHYSTEEVLKIRAELPACLHDQFPLRGETSKEILSAARRLRLMVEQSDLAASMDDADSQDEMLSARAVRRRSIEANAKEAKELERAKKHPTTYPVESFLAVCREAVEIGGFDGKTLELQDALRELCLDPATKLEAGPWYFADLVNVLREHQQQWTEEKSKIATTAVVRQVDQNLEYAVGAGILTLLMGAVSLGQSFAARHWCETHPGLARYIEVPPSNDEASFFRAIARAVGLGNFLNYKNVQIRERVEFVLQNGGPCLVLNRAENLWPQKNLREAFPGRLAWLLDQVQKGASALMISGPQFFMQQRTCEKTGWHSPEFRKKIDHLDRLPDNLSVEDVTAIARVMLPEADPKIQEAMAIYAVGQQRDLAALEAISKRAQFLAQRDGRTQRTAQDVIEALKFVSGSDKLLRECFNPTAKASSHFRPSTIANSAPFQSNAVPSGCETKPLAMPAFDRPVGSMEMREK